MLFNDNYFSIKETKKCTYKVRGSEFIGFATPVYTEDEVKKKRKKLKEEYPDATHHCYAFILNPDKSHEHSSDDGEPSGTAGRPILKQINALNLTNILVVSVRYFGGKKLGVPGLIEAYGINAKEVLAECEIVEKHLECSYTVKLPYALQNEIYKVAGKYDAQVDAPTFDQSHATFTVKVRKNNSIALEEELKNIHQLEFEFVEMK